MLSISAAPMRISLPVLPPQTTAGPCPSMWKPLAMRSHLGQCQEQGYLGRPHTDQDSNFRQLDCRATESSIAFGPAHPAILGFFMHKLVPLRVMGIHMIF